MWCCRPADAAIGSSRLVSITVSSAKVPVSVFSVVGKSQGNENFDRTDTRGRVCSNCTFRGPHTIYSKTLKLYSFLFKLTS